MKFSPLSCYLVPLRPNYSPKHRQHTFLPECQWPSFTPINLFDLAVPIFPYPLFYFFHFLLYYVRRTV
jgi:hypothetical protein